eukprot:6213154-Pleurochrysis_carterae.AAC.3
MPVSRKLGSLLIVYAFRRGRGHVAQVSAVTPQLTLAAIGKRRSHRMRASSPRCVSALRASPPTRQKGGAGPAAHQCGAGALPVSRDARVGASAVRLSHAPPCGLAALWSKNTLNFTNGNCDTESVGIQFQIPRSFGALQGCI